MTAFAQIAVQGLRLELKSVNQRFLDLSLKVPDALRSSEAALRQLCSRHIRRGKVELRASWGVLSTEAVGNTIGEKAGEITDPKLMWRNDTAAYVAALNAQQARLMAALPGTLALGTADVLKLIEQFHAQNDASGQDAAEAPDILSAAASLLVEFNAAREAEGEALCAAIRSCLVSMASLVQDAQRLVPQQHAAFALRFTERWQQALGYVQEGSKNTLPNQDPSQNFDADRALQERQVSELAAFAVRSDVAEEVTRLLAHIAEVQRLLAQGGELGKRLDFMCQEMLREANTLGSKSASIELTRVSIDLKVLIEQIKEQVQNIE